MTLNHDSITRWGQRLGNTATRLGADFPGERPDRQPVHTVYGGAHLFTAATAGRLGELALAALDRWLATPPDLASVLGLPDDLASQVHRLVTEKLQREPVEDFRIDFEDGYGHRPDDEEDGHARSAAGELATGMASGSLPPFTGIRVKSLSGELHRRSLRTLDLFLTAAVESGGGLPDGFTVTLPKIQDLEQVVVLSEALTELEQALGIEPIPIELMVETPQTIIDRDGTAGVRKFVDAGQGRVRG
ncbi:MAG TPA: phosphoenolpyruvate kinase, partial [Acidimicrobiia bacterium]|nr:phosphoenolpyruvate kinase [Acidimicrobiia bacterium]